MPSVVIVDDSMLIRRELTRFLEAELGFTVLATGSDGIEGVELYKKHKPDLVTMDITMPNMDGIEALKQILAFDPKAKVMIVSAIKDNEKILQALDVGAKCYIKKPLQLKQLDFVQQLKDDITQTLAA